MSNLVSGSVGAVIGAITTVAATWWAISRAAETASEERETAERKERRDALLALSAEFRTLLRTQEVSLDSDADDISEARARIRFSQDAYRNALRFLPQVPHPAGESVYVAGAWVLAYNSRIDWYNRMDWNEARKQLLDAMLAETTRRIKVALDDLGRLLEGATVSPSTS